MQDHRDLVVDMAQDKGWKWGIEVGLGSGMLFARLVAAGIDMVGVDLGRRADRRKRVEAIEPAGGAICLLWMSSGEAALRVADEWADFVFIDAGHSYHAAKADIAAWRPKVKPGGFLMGHDYHPKFPGVIRAVDESYPYAAKLPFWVWAVRC